MKTARLTVRSGFYVMRSGAIAHVADEQPVPCTIKGKSGTIIIWFGHETGTSREIMWDCEGKRVPQKKDSPDDLTRRKRGK